MAFVPGRKTAPKGIMEPKVYRPTMAEFSDFLGFVEKIEREDQAHLAGICKIIPPDEWVPRKSGYGIENLEFEIESPIEQVRSIVMILREINFGECQSPRNAIFAILRALKL